MFSTKLSLPRQISLNIQKSSDFTPGSNDIEPTDQGIKINNSIFQRDHNHLHALDYIFIQKERASLQKLFRVNCKNFNFSSNSKISQSAQDIKKQSRLCSIEAARKSLIHECILTEKIDVIYSFLNSSKYIFDLNPIKGLTCMHFAAIGNSVETIDLLDFHNFSICSTDQWGRTPLHYAALNPNKEILLALLRCGASVTDEDCFGTTPLDLLNHESQSINPLSVLETQYQTLLPLLASFIADLLQHNGFFDNYPTLSQISSYLKPASQVALAIQNKESFFNKKTTAIALCIFAEQFTVSKLVLSTFLLAKTSQLAIKSIQNVANFGKLNSYDSLKNILVNGLQTALVTNQYFSVFPSHFFQKHFNEWSSSAPFVFQSSQIGKQSQIEWKNFTASAKNIVSFLMKRFDQFTSNYSEL
ncbi:MAG: hypothetical protein S4CHLAM6_00290 [Chlamydiae bacterium]|nr:hypothetical protein [Chlamydiota bacterium]